MAAGSGEAWRGQRGTAAHQGLERVSVAGHKYLYQDCLVALRAPKYGTRSCESFETSFAYRLKHERIMFVLEIQSRTDTFFLSCTGFEFRKPTSTEIAQLQLVSSCSGDADRYPSIVYGGSPSPVVPCICACTDTFDDDTLGVAYLPNSSQPQRPHSLTHLLIHSFTHSLIHNTDDFHDKPVLPFWLYAEHRSWTTCRLCHQCQILALQNYMAVSVSGLVQFQEALRRCLWSHNTPLSLCQTQHLISRTRRRWPTGATTSKSSIRQNSPSRPFASMTLLRPSTCPTA